MKKILLSILQISVTIGLLIWVFHDPTQRAQMAKALRLADYRWVGAGLFARTLRNLRTLDVGIATDHLVTFTVDPRLAG